MKYNIFFIIILIFPTFVFGGETWTVSETDVNRIVCPQPIKDIFFSEEKGLTSKIAGSDVFIKFPAAVIIDQETGEKRTQYFDGDSAELFLVCGEMTYSLILKPLRIPAQTIFLKAKQDHSVQAEEFKNKDTEEVLAALMKAAIEERLPANFKDNRKNNTYKIERSGSNLTVVYFKEYSGNGYIIKEFRIHSPIKITILPAEISGFKNVTNPAAIMLTSETFSGWVRAFVIERSR